MSPRAKYWPLTDAEIERHLRAIAADLWWPTQTQDERSDREHQIQPNQPAHRA